MRSPFHRVSFSSPPSSPGMTNVLEAVDRKEVKGLPRGSAPLHFSEAWVEQAKAGMTIKQMELLDAAVDGLCGNLHVRDLQVDDEGGHFNFTHERHDYKVKFTRNPQNLTDINHLAIYTTGKLIVQIGGNNVVPPGSGGNEASGIRAGSLRRSSNSSLERDLREALDQYRSTSPPVSARPQSIPPTGSAESISPGADNDADSSNHSELERDLLAAFDELGPTSPPVSARPQSVSPAGSAEGISPGAGNDADFINQSELERDLLAAFNELGSTSPSPGPVGSARLGPSGVGFKRPLPSSAAQPQPKRLATQAGGVMQPPAAIPGTALAPINLIRETPEPDDHIDLTHETPGPDDHIDLTGETPGPSTAPAAETGQAQTIGRQKVAEAQKRKFKAVRNACMSKLVMCFSDDELAGLRRDTARSEADRRAGQCRVVPKERKLLLERLDSWLKESKTELAIPNDLDDIPLLVTLEGVPMDVGEIAAYRKFYCGDYMQPLPTIAPETDEQADIHRKNNDVADRFKLFYKTETLKLPATASEATIAREHNSNAREIYRSAMRVAKWATEQGVNLTTLPPYMYESFRDDFSRATETGNQVSNRKTKTKDFFDFLKKEYEKRKEEQQTTAP